MTSVEKIFRLFAQLYPKGRAFRITPGADTENFHNGLSQSFADFYDDANSLLNSILPDNLSFTATDATDWERRLGMISNSAVSLADRKLAIARKMAHPGTIKSRQHYKYIEGQLRAAGFDVYVHENRFPLYPTGYETQNPFDLYPTGWIYNQLGDFQLGDFQLGSTYPDIVVNHLEVERDQTFDIGTNLKNTFFIGGLNVGDYANVDQDRKLELRQLILKLKPVQTYGFIFVNYI